MENLTRQRPWDKTPDTDTAENISNSLWSIIEGKKLTWEQLNKGVTIKFIFENKYYTINTRLGDYYSMSIDGYQKLLTQKAINAVKN